MRCVMHVLLLTRKPSVHNSQEIHHEVQASSVDDGHENGRADMRPTEMMMMTITTAHQSSFCFGASTKRFNERFICKTYRIMTGRQNGSPPKREETLTHTRTHICIHR